MLVEALRPRGRTSPLAGRIVARTELLRALRQRLLLAAAWADDPTILDEPIVEPVFVVGTGRSGTSILHELLALDPDEPGAAHLGAVPPGRGARPRRRRRPGPPATTVHAFWADLQPAYETMHHNDGDEPNECIFATMLEFLSDQWGGTYEVPTYSAHLVAADHTEAYRYHRRVLQTLQRRARGDRWVLKAPSHLAQLRTLFAVYPDARVVQIHRDPLKTVPVDDQPDGHDPVDALRARWTSTRSRRSISIGLRHDARRHDRRARAAASCPTTGSSTCSTAT